MRKRWKLTKNDPAKIAEISAALGISELTSSLLVTRGCTNAETASGFLNPSISDLHEPLLLRGLESAMKRVFRAIECKEKILVWGDYDVDGTTGTVVLRKALKLLGAETGYHVPHRFIEGYGLNIEKLRKAKEDGYSVVISVDTGARAFEAAAWAKGNGIDLIITDHHLADPELGNPDAFEVVNPNQPGCDYPDKNLAGVGVAFKLAHALLREKGRENLVEAFLKMVAVGTVADMMQLTGENRAIVSLGLQGLPQARNHGLRALMQVADCTRDMTSYDIGFRIAPRINAAGRMDEAKTVVELFEAESFDIAYRHAQTLNRRNQERQAVQKQISELAFQEFLNAGGSSIQSHVAVVAGYGWHRGVIGLAASRIAEKIYRPSLVISLEDGIGHGSARSIASYHLLNGLESCSDLFEKFGGHAQAAGFTIKEVRIAELRERINRHAAASIADEDLIPALNIDSEIDGSQLNLGLIDETKKLEPFGIGNPKPVFATRGLYVYEEPLVMKEKHIKLKLKDKGGRYFEAVWWDGVDRSEGLGLKKDAEIDLAFTPEANIWQGNTRLQLVVHDCKAG